MLFAFEMMNKMGSRINSRTFERYKLVFSENQKKRIVSQETRDKIGNAHRGMKRSEEAKRKISESQKGKIISEETKAKLRGKIVSEETRRKMSLSSKGRKGHPISPETIAKIKLAVTGKKKSKESIEKSSKKLKEINDLRRIKELGITKEQFHEIASQLKSITELKEKFNYLDKSFLLGLLKSWYGTLKFHEAFKKTKITPAQINRFKRLGVKDFNEFDSIAKKCNTLEELNNSFPCNEKYIRKCLNVFYGNSSFYKIFNKTPILSEESRNKMAFAKLGKKRDLETRMKISKNHKSKRYGIPKEVCLKISLAQKGRKRNSSGMSGKKHSEETKEKIRKAKRNYANI